MTLRFAIAAVAVALITLGAVVPSAAADTGVVVSACGSYNYGDDGSGSNRDNAKVRASADASDPDADVVVELPDRENVQDAGTDLAADLADAESGDDEDGVPDPFDGTGFLHVSVYQYPVDGDDEFAGAGTDDTDQNWDTACPP